MKKIFFLLIFNACLNVTYGQPGPANIYLQVFNKKGKQLYFNDTTNKKCQIKAFYNYGTETKSAIGKTVPYMKDGVEFARYVIFECTPTLDKIEIKYKKKKMSISIHGLPLDYFGTFFIEKIEFLPGEFTLDFAKTEELADQNSQLKTANMDYFTRGNQKIAFQKKKNSIGVAFKNEMSKASVMKLIVDWELTIDTVYMNGLFFVLNYPIDLNSESVKTIRERIILFKDVTALGDILIQTENNLVLATQDMIIKWKPETSEAVKQTFIKKYSLTEIRKTPYMTGGFQYRIEPCVAYASTDICLKLLEADIVGFAEPVIISTSEDD